MLVLNEKCGVAKQIREVEEILREKGIFISFRHDGLLITAKKEDGTEEDYVIIDPESPREISSVFPTEIEPTRIQRLSNYISGE